MVHVRNEWERKFAEERAEPGERREERGGGSGRKKRKGGVSKDAREVEDTMGTAGK